MRLLSIKRNLSLYDLVLTLKMAHSVSGLIDLIDDLDLGDMTDTGYEKDVDVEIIDGFYHQNVAFMNDNVRLFADFWMKLYSNCCLQRDFAVESLNDGKPSGS